MSRLIDAFRVAGSSIRLRLLTGLAVIVPVLVTVWVVRFLFNSLDGWLRPIEARYLGRHVPGAGLLATFLLVYLAGLIVRNLGGRHLVRWLEQILLRLPLIGDVYGSSKQIMEAISSPTGLGFRKVVSFDYPRPGIRAIGFVTREARSAQGEPIYVVFMPTTPNPTTGFLLFMPVDGVEETGLTVEQALKMVVSAGVVTPSGFRPRLSDLGPRWAAMPGPAGGTGDRPAAGPAGDGA